MNIVVTTPTGHVGQQVTALLVRSGLRPTVLVRDPDRLDPAVRERVEVSVVDLDDSNAVVEATRGADGLYWVNPSPMVDDPVAAYTALGENAARAVRDNRIPRTVFQSSIGAEKRHGVGEIDGLAATELLVEKAAGSFGGAVLHLRCGYFFTNLLFALDDLRAGVTRVITPLDQPLPWVAPRDIAEVGVLRLLAGWSGRAVQAVHGPQDLTWSQAAAIVAEAIGRPFRAERITDEQMHDAMAAAGLSEGFIAAMMGMSIGSREDFVPEQPRDATTTTPTTLGAWAYEELRPALANGA